MKVLWFSNTPAMGSEYLNAGFTIKSTGGWLYSLNDNLKSKLDLSVVFHYPYKVDRFTYKDTDFYPIYIGNVLKENIKYRFFGNIKDEEYLVEYLKIIDKVRPDIIHIHGTENSFLCILGKTEVPVLISIQGNLTVYQHKFKSGFHGEYIYLKERNRTLKSRLLGRKSFIKGFQKMRKMAKVEEKHLKKAKYILGRTDWDRRITRVLAPQSKYYVSNEMLRSDFYNERWLPNWDSDKIILFTINGDSYYKGFETLCHSLYLLNGLGLNVEWRVAGVSKSSLINMVTKKFLKSKYPTKGLILLGALEEKELIKNMKESSVYIMPSHIENSPNNLCEAMILGMPCVATYAGGTSSILKDRIEGLLVQDGDPWALTGAILEIINDKERAIEMGANARNSALARHSIEEITNGLIRIYKSVVDQIES